MGPFFNEYGLYIIKQYPVQFARYFLWPNANHYYAPPVEFMENYNSGQDSVAFSAAKWFKYTSLLVTTRTKDKTITILNFYTILPGVFSMVILFALISFSMLRGWKQDTPFRKGILLGASVWLLNAGFTILASPAALRFQTFPILLTTIYSALLIDWIWKMASLKENSKANESFIFNKALE